MSFKHSVLRVVPAHVTSNGLSYCLSSPTLGRLLTEFRTDSVELGGWAAMMRTVTLFAGRSTKWIDTLAELDDLAVKSWFSASFMATLARYAYIADDPLQDDQRSKIRAYLREVISARYTFTSLSQKNTAMNNFEAPATQGSASRREATEASNRCPKLKNQLGCRVPPKNRGVAAILRFDFTSANVRSTLRSPEPANRMSLGERLHTRNDWPQGAWIGKRSGVHRAGMQSKRLGHSGRVRRRVVGHPGAEMGRSRTSDLVRLSGLMLPVDIASAGFAQKWYSETFSSRGRFGGQTIGEGAGSLRPGLSPNDAPIDVIVRDGNSLILNTRSSQALIRAGIPRSS